MKFSAVEKKNALFRSKNYFSLHVNSFLVQVDRNQFQRPNFIKVQAIYSKIC